MFSLNFFNTRIKYPIHPRPSSFSFFPTAKAYSSTSRTSSCAKKDNNIILNQIADRSLILIALDWTRPKDPPLSLGQASLLANLRHHNINVIPGFWAVNANDFSHEAVTKFVMDHADSKMDVGIGAYVWNESAVQSILNELKKQKFPGRIILGGPQISYVKQGLEKFYPQADIFIRGYGEEVLVQLLKSSELSPKIKGIHYANQFDWGFSAAADLEGLPSPFLKRHIGPQRFIRWETQRGCPFRCAFCQHRESDITMIRREFSKNRVFEEVEWMAAHSEIQDVAVLDPTFNSGRNYLAVMDKLIERQFKGKLSLQCRIEMVKEEFLNKIVELNKTAKVVLEFGLQTIHPEEQKIIDRPNNMKLVEKILTRVKELHIQIEISLIFGLPRQTVKSFRASVDFCKKHEAPIIHAFPLMLLRGTPLHDQKVLLGLRESNEIASLEIPRIQADIPHVISSPSFSYEEWKEMAEIAASLERENKTLSC